LLRANLDNVVEKADEPEKVLNQLRLDMRNQLVQVKTQVATAIAEGHKLQKRSQEHKDEAGKWFKKAEQAVQQGNDTAARAALARYNDISKQAQRYLDQKKDQDQLVVTMRNVLRQLETKIAEVETNLDLLETRKRNALLQQRVFDALNKANNPKERDRTSKAQDTIIDAEARAQALADLHQRDLTTRLEQLEQLAEAREIEQQLQALKHDQRHPGEPRLLREGQNDSASLLRPRPRLDESIRRRRPVTGNLQGQAEPSTSRDINVEYLKKLLNPSPNNDS
jgi:phage shock protein A